MAPNSEQYNEDELEPPQWMNGEFFTKVLKSYEKSAKDVEVKSFKICPATVKGDHYASVMFRAALEYRLDAVDHSKSIIIKTMPEAEGHKKEMLEQFDVFEVEIGMYTEVLPRFEKYLRAVGDDSKLMAPIIYHELAPHELIIFEDIVPLGYNVMRDRFANADEAKYAYAKLAKWHAISYKIIKEEPHYFDKYRHSLFSQRDIKQNLFLSKSVELFMDFMRKTPELQEYLLHFERVVEKVVLLDDVVASHNEYRVAPLDDAYYVLSHGDFHLKNMMFKHNPGTGKLEDVMLLDFQFSHVGPITNDLMYSIYMLLDNNLRPNKAEFLRYYVDVFRTTLQKIDFDGSLPTFDKLQEQMKRHRFYEIFSMITFLPMWSKFFRGEIDIAILVNDAELRRKLYDDKEYLDELLVLIPKYLHLGYLEV